MSVNAPAPLLDELLARLHALPRKDREAVLSRLPEEQQAELQRRRLLPGETGSPSQAREARFRGLSPWLIDILVSVEEAKKTNVRPDLAVSDATLDALQQLAAALAERDERQSESSILPGLADAFRSLWAPRQAAS